MSNQPIGHFIFTVSVAQLMIRKVSHEDTWDNSSSSVTAAADLHIYHFGTLLLNFLPCSSCRNFVVVIRLKKIYEKINLIQFWMKKYTFVLTTAWKSNYDNCSFEKKKKVRNIKLLSAAKKKTESMILQEKINI